MNTLREHQSLPPAQKKIEVKNRMDFVKTSESSGGIAKPRGLWNKLADSKQKNIQKIENGMVFHQYLVPSQYSYIYL
jgi:hypothetical protein